MSPAFEIKTERDRCLGIGPIAHRDVLRIHYRKAGTRAWAKVLVVLDPGQSFSEAEEWADEIVALHDRRERGGRP